MLQADRLQFRVPISTCSSSVNGTQQPIRPHYRPPSQRARCAEDSIGTCGHPLFLAPLLFQRETHDGMRPLRVK